MHEATKRRLYEDYVEKLASGDSDALESSRDFGDLDATSWRTEVTTAYIGVAILGLFFCVGVLIAFFAWIQHLTGG